jgi:glycerophosphoryl diester phosphodiesterase
MKNFLRQESPGILTSLTRLRLICGFSIMAMLVPNILTAKQTKPFVVIAHRGASGYLPEHTLEAKALAHAMNPDYIEQDVVLTKDDVPIIIHDHYLDTVTNVNEVFPKRKRSDGRFYAIDFTWEEICKLRVFERIDLNTGKAAYKERYPLLSSFTAVRFRISSLEEEITLIQGLNKSRQMNIGLYVELKAPWFHKKEGKDIASIVLPLLKKMGYHKKSDNIIIQCFDPACLKRMRYILKTKIPLVQLIADNSWDETPGVDYNAMLTKEGLKIVSQYADGIGPWIDQLVSKTKKGKVVVTAVAENAHKSGLVIHPYTARKDSLPENISSMDELLKILKTKVKADGIFSDFPDIAVRFRDGNIP